MMKSRTRLRSKALAWMIAGALLCTAQAGAQDASGVFEGTRAALQVADAYAFRGASALDGQPVWIVAVSNVPFVDERVDRYVDRRYVLDHYFRGEVAAVVYFELEDDGTYRGLSYDFGPDDACELCRDDGVKAEIEIDGGRIAGSLLWEMPDRGFDVKVDVAISPEAHGEPLAEDGGEPAKAYRAFHQAIRSRDEVSLRMAFSQAVNATWAEAIESEQGGSYLQSWIDDHMTEIKGLRGWVRENHAVLLVNGVVGDRQLRAEVLLVRQGDTWHVDDEMVRGVD